MTMTTSSLMVRATHGRLALQRILRHSAFLTF